MPPRARGGKLYQFFTLLWPNMSRGGPVIPSPLEGVKGQMVAIAATMFIALFGWGQEYFHWSDPSGKVQLALFTSFVLGIVCGYKTRG
jgi:hypothetical protein